LTQRYHLVLRSCLFLVS